MAPETEPRYRLLATVRLLAVQRAAAREELTAASRRHRDHYLGVAEDVAAHMLGADLGSWLPLAHAEHDNLLAALAFSLENDEGDRALQLASALAYYWYRVSHIADGRTLLARSRALAPPASPWRPRGLVADAWLASGARAKDAVAAAQAAVAACTGRGDELEGLAWLALATAHLTPTAPPDLSLVAAEQALGHASLFAHVGAGEGAALAEQLRGLAAFRGGDLPGAYAHLQRARETFRRLRGTLDAGWTLVQLAEVALALGDDEVARSAAADAVHDFRDRGDPRGLAASFAALGRAYGGLGEEERARQVLEEGLRLARSRDYAAEATALAEALHDLTAV